MLHLQPLRQTAGVLILLACLAGAGDASAASALTAADLALLNRVTWGVNASSAKTLETRGVRGYLRGQLRSSGQDPLPPEAQAQIDAMRISKESIVDLVTETDQQARALYTMSDPAQKAAALEAHKRAVVGLANEAATRSLLRDLYSPNQLLEQTTWFWMNHFNVHQYKSNLQVLVGDYEENAIRAHAFGKFRDLLSATLHHPAMLHYLDNDQNAVGHINENYARELMELHTMGVGSGYTQQDVEALARILTGVSGNPAVTPSMLKPEWQSQYVRDGLFEFNPQRHDYGEKVLLGHVIKGRGLAEVDEALDILSREPATARFISRKLALYFVADDPPPALVDRMARVFQRSDGDIRAVLEAMITAPEFRASLGRKFKDPAHYVISALRLAYDDRVILTIGPVQNWLTRMGEPLYGRDTPDGYPLSQAGWAGPGGMSTHFEVARQIGASSQGLFKTPGPPPKDRPAFPLLQNSIYFGGLSQALSPSTLAALDQATSPQDWNTLFLSSPEFMRR
jgi:uncharacterized protein (DUF1800 family)